MLTRVLSPKNYKYVFFISDSSELHMYTAIVLVTNRRKKKKGEKISTVKILDLHKMWTLK